MGSPMVFQTAPPHPASKARITWSPQFAGGPEASQNGFGHRMPAKFVVRSATATSKRLENAERGALSIGDGVHDLAPAVHAVPAGVILRIAGASGGTVDANQTAVGFELQPISEARLAEGEHDHVARDLIFRARDGLGRLAPLVVGRPE